MLRLCGDQARKAAALALALAWMIGMGLWLYPEVKEEFEKKRYWHRQLDRLWSRQGTRRLGIPAPIPERPRR
jgi:hypothetical protein